jgi:hypothetical protein
LVKTPIKTVHFFEIAVNLDSSDNIPSPLKRGGLQAGRGGEGL